MKKDARILLTELKNHILNDKNQNKYDRFLKTIIENKYFSITTPAKIFKIYSPSLAYLFSSNEIKAKNLETKEDFILDSNQYFETYADAYTDGEKHFEKTYKVPAEILISGAKMMVANISRNYYHTKTNNSLTGWNGVKNSNPIIITHKIIKDYGFYSGVLNRADAYIKEHPDTFKDFHNLSLGKEYIKNDTLEGIITHKNSKAIVDAILIQYKNIKGKRLKLLFMALQKTKLLPLERIASKFHRCCVNEFDHDVASFNAMNDHKFNTRIDSDELNEIISFIENIKNNK